ncbi:alanine:cation symporter family protein [Staphylococcus aureus]
MFLTIAVTLFAFSSVVGNYYYGQSNIRVSLSTNRVILFIFKYVLL